MIYIYDAKKRSAFYDEIITAIHWFSSIYQDTEITFHIHLYPYKKILGTELDRYHINSGIFLENKIVVYREEEVIKVLFHEMVHAYGLDQGLGEQPDYSRFLSSSSVYSPLEAYAELFAEYCYICYRYGYNEEMWHKQVGFSYQQACKIYNGNKIHQSTYAFEYYILKYVYMVSGKFKEILYQKEGMKEAVEKFDFSIFKKLQGDENLRMTISL
jgi:hypothetical protein